MALRKVNSDIPKGAVILEERDAITYQWQEIYKWRNKWDVWAYRYGLAALSGTAAITAGYITRRHRIKIKLRDYGYLTSMFCVMLAPSVAAAALHVEYVTNDILIFKTPCPVCLQTRAAAIQLASGLFYPLLFSPVACTLMALRAGIRIPPHTQKLEILKMWWKFTKPMSMNLTIMAGIQIITATGLTYFEAKQLYDFQEKSAASSKKK